MLMRIQRLRAKTIARSNAETQPSRAWKFFSKTMLTAGHIEQGVYLVGKNAFARIRWPNAES